MSKYICDHSYECLSKHCPGRIIYDENKLKLNLINPQGYHGRYYKSNHPLYPCERGIVYFVPYFEYLMKRSLKEKNE